MKTKRISARLVKVKGHGDGYTAKRFWYSKSMGFCPRRKDATQFSEAAAADLVAKFSSHAGYTDVKAE